MYTLPGLSARIQIYQQREQDLSDEGLEQPKNNTYKW